MAQAAEIRTLWRQKEPYNVPRPLEGGGYGTRSRRQWAIREGATWAETCGISSDNSAAGGGVL